eukprot:4556223-Amphidinium_carterae.3
MEAIPYELCCAKTRRGYVKWLNLRLRTMRKPIFHTSVSVPQFCQAPAAHEGLYGCIQRFSNKEAQEYRPWIIGSASQQSQNATQTAREAKEEVIFGGCILDGGAQKK